MRSFGRSSRTPHENGATPACLRFCLALAVGHPRVNYAPFCGCLAVPIAPWVAARTYRQALNLATVLEFQGMLFHCCASCFSWRAVAMWWARRERQPSAPMGSPKRVQNLTIQLAVLASSTARLMAALLFTAQ